MEKQKAKYNKLGSLLWALKKLWKLDKNFIFFIFATVPFAVVLPLLQSYFSKVLIDKIGLGAEFSELLAVSVLFIAAISIGIISESFVRNRCYARRYYPTQKFQLELFAEPSFYTDFENTEKQDYKELLDYCSWDACSGNCSLEFLWQDLSQSLIHALGIVTYASLLVFIDPMIFFIVAIVSVLSYFTTRWQTVYYEKHKKEWEKETRKRDYFQGLSNDFASAKDIKLYNLEGWINSMMQHYQNYILMWEKKCSLRGVWAELLAGLMTFIQDGAAYLFLIGLLLQGKISVGDFVFYFGIVASIASFLVQIISDVAKLNFRADRIALYRQAFDYPNKFNRAAGVKLPQKAPKIEFKNVYYRYSGATEDTLKGINFTIESGESIALVGLNGAGKTTLVKLLCGLYAPTGGEILVDGKRIEEYNIFEYYTLISAVFQKLNLIALTFLEFITTSDPDRKTAREDAIRALTLAGLWEKIAALPNGIDTHLVKGIYDDGVDLSGGEMQKLFLARAIYKNGLIFVLDEPTAALDPIAENDLYLQYRSLTKGKTSLYISHRFASTRFCDRIILLQDGIITESGTHEELMRQNGHYAYMFGVQSKYYKEGDINE